MTAWTRRRTAPALTMVVALLVAAALPAAAAETATTFQVASGGLAISAPTSANLGSGAAGGSVSASLGQVRVDDTRGVLLGTYAARVSSTDFTTGGGTEAETIAAANAAYTGGLVTPGGTVVCTSLLVAEPLANTTKVAMNATGATGTNSCTWNPTIAVTLPAASVAGTYTGTITHSVA
jgi:hypothetical protein